MMSTKGCYLMILAVYISLWTCQLIVCHLTHSLIVLADSYINLYKILDISLGILHLNKQLEIKRREQTTGDDKFHVSKLFGYECTYDLKRLPVLGAFVNGLFLAALLMSAAIEGVQTCFHVGHVNNDGETSILMEHPITYPSVLAGFAVVGFMMQWCSSKAHEMREEELQSESLLELRSAGCSKMIDPLTGGAPVGATSVPMLELNAGRLRHSLTIPSKTPNHSDNEDKKRNTICSEDVAHRGHNCGEFKTMTDTSVAADSFETVPLDDQPTNNGTVQAEQLISNSLDKIATDVGTKGVKNGTANAPGVGTISKDLETGEVLKQHQKRIAGSKGVCDSDRWWLTVRYCTSPFALLTCALIFYCIKNELITEIADSSLAILVVVILFTSSYPPMKKAGKVLLQSAPDPVDVESLKASLLALSPIIADISDLHVWSLTARSNRVATCKILIKADKVESTQQVSVLLREAEFKFLEQNIKCTAIQPVFVRSPV